MGSETANWGLSPICSFVWKGALIFQICASLATPQLRVLAALRDELGVRSVFDGFSLVEHDDAVEARHGGEPMRDHDGRASLHELLERVLHELLALGIKCARRLVQHEDRRVGEHGARDGDALALPARELDAALAGHGVKALRKPLDELERVCLACRLAYLVHRGVRAGIGDILGDGAVEEQRLLRDVGHLPPQALLRALRHVLPVY